MSVCRRKQSDLSHSDCHHTRGVPAHNLLVTSPTFLSPQPPRPPALLSSSLVLLSSAGRSSAAVLFTPSPPLSFINQQPLMYPRLPLQPSANVVATGGVQSAHSRYR
ncbi:hypothetical protein R3P38DRAFT_3235069 [Favolaschia claudopus]|uniref:Uncharacterized protein n=1 Tax=Favolaschia claudopus TaxID=2862362 RepID=A0AAV9ZGJ4_9AGAR